MHGLTQRFVFLVKHHGVPLALILTFAAGLRLYRLSEQSLWLDEYLFVGLLPAESLRAHMLFGRTLVPELCISPLYFVIQYLWAHTVGMSVFVLRLLPVLTSLAGIPVAYALGVLIKSRFTGVVTALLLALSPQHLWYAQELRPYTQLSILALCSMYCLLRASGENLFRWWVLNWIANGLALWTYAIGGLIFMVEGLFLLLFSRRSLKTLVIWSMSQLLIILPWLYWAFQTPFVHRFFLTPTLHELINAIFFTDLVSHYRDLLPGWKTNSISVFPYAAQILLFPRYFFDFLLGSILMFAGVYGFFSCLYALKKSKEGGLYSHILETRGLFLLALFLPPVTLSLLELIFNMPFVNPMSIMYGTVGLYLFIGILLEYFKSKKLRYATLFGIVFLYFYQLMLLIPWNTRTDYQKAAEHVLTHAQPEDRVMCFQMLAPEDCMGYYLKGKMGAVIRITTLQSACEHAVAFLYDSSIHTSGEKNVWLAIQRFFFQMVSNEENALSELEEGLAARALAFEKKLFPGHYNLVLYKISKKEQSNEPPPFTRVPMLFHYDEDTLFDNLGLKFNSQEDREEASRILRNHVFAWPPIGSFMPMMESLDLIVGGEFKFAHAMAHYAIRKQPKFGMAYFAAGLAALGLNDTWLAENYFERAFELHPALKRAVGASISHLLSRDFLGAATDIEAIQKQGYVYFIPAMKRVLRSLQDIGNVI